ncbi:unnamed protein product [Sphenostylis stenocarpa]|uniref:GPI ethanolamine phosphate transferase 1 n=1 Tax=Sphenostylis stenocarpa TaxID=92480 RepID=A0AA86V4R2_9FABA|nr:unnamed protein product [Sphenostylis stenocarpa]
MVLPLFSENSLLSRLTSIFLGFAPPFLLLSIGYEALFYAGLALVLMAWILFENTLLNLNIVNKSSDSTKSFTHHLIHGSDNRSLQLSDARIPLVFLCKLSSSLLEMVLFNVAFFGTGNFASIASFEISSVYRFITIFSPFLMAALLIFNTTQKLTTKSGRQLCEQRWMSVDGDQATMDSSGRQQIVTTLTTIRQRQAE